MNKRKKLPIGIESFEEMRKEDFYYVDKTRWIEQLLAQWGKVNLFTRPRWFGKSLNMSMLQTFFEVGADASLFDGLYISKNKEVCKQYLGKFPVVSISLKGVNGNTFDEARSCLVKVINREARRLQNLSESEKLTQVDKELFEKLFSQMKDDGTLSSSLLELSELLEKHYEEKVIVLIDEYDVPLAKANENGYYDEMVLLIRNLFENVLKTNHSLKFAVLTGCLRVAKESIFTGLNNFKVFPITKVMFDECFGFTDAEVKDMLHYYQQDELYNTVKEWYDGYRFGNVDVYCPWDVINYCDEHLDDPSAKPRNYWSNTSGNDIIQHFITDIYSGRDTAKAELERLVNGEAIQKEISEELTYKELYTSIENIWSTLFMTGYLTQRGEAEDNRYNLVIPNREIRNIMTEHIMKMFKSDVSKDGAMVDSFCNALSEGKPEIVETLFTEYMKKTISVRDTFVRKPIKENFYHGILLGILSFKGEWIVKSNKEAGNGFSDILIWIDDLNIGIVIEIKYAEVESLEEECQKALHQINAKDYISVFYKDDIRTILKYGIACNRKKCRVLMEK